LCLNCGSIVLIKNNNQTLIVTDRKANKILFKQKIVLTQEFIEAFQKIL
jgi:hypothetical protein